jgi:hypothetical protein
MAASTAAKTTTKTKTVKITEVPETTIRTMKADAALQGLTLGEWLTDIVSRLDLVGRGHRPVDHGGKRK